MSRSPGDSARTSGDDSATAHRAEAAETGPAGVAKPSPSETPKAAAREQAKRTKFAATAQSSGSSGIDELRKRAADRLSRRARATRRGLDLLPGDFDRVKAELEQRLARDRATKTVSREELERRALAGEADAQVLLALEMQIGNDASKSRAQSMELLRSAANSGHARAMAELGRLLLEGDDATTNTVEAEKWLRQALGHGESEAALLLASAQRLGLLPSIEGEKNVDLLLRAAREGNVAAQSFVARLSYPEVPADFDSAEVRRFARAAAEKGDADAMMYCAHDAMLRGNFDEHRRWLERAAAADYSLAVVFLAHLGKATGNGDAAIADGIAFLEQQAADPERVSAETLFDLARVCALAKPDAAMNAKARSALEQAAPYFPRAAYAVALLDDGAPLAVVMKQAADIEDMDAYAMLQRRKADAVQAEEGESEDSLPVLLHAAATEYPLELSKTGVGGKVVLEFVVTQDGSVSNIKVVSSAHPALAAVAIETIERATFRPGRRTGKVVATRMQWPMTFVPP